MIKLVACAVLASVAFAASARAGEAPDFSATAALVSDYTVRGVSQTSGDPAAQGSIGILWNGFGASVWASNVSFADAEVDFSGFYTWDAVGSSFVVGTIYYVYPGSAPDTDYWEGFASFSRTAGRTTFAASGYVTPDYSFDSGVAVYGQASISVDLVAALAFTAQAGRQWIENNAAAALPDYWRWSAGLAYELEPVTITLIYEDANIPSGVCARNLCGPQVVGGISVSF